MERWNAVVVNYRSTEGRGLQTIEPFQTPFHHNGTYGSNPALTYVRM